MSAALNIPRAGVEKQLTAAQNLNNFLGKRNMALAVECTLHLIQSDLMVVDGVVS